MRRKPVSDWTMEDLKQILERVRMSCGEDDYKIMNAVVGNGWRNRFVAPLSW